MRATHAGMEGIAQRPPGDQAPAAVIGATNYRRGATRRGNAARRAREQMTQYPDSSTPVN